MNAALKPIPISPVEDIVAELRAGRMVISGKMADVCAELDRLIDLDNQRQMFPH